MHWQWVRQCKYLLTTVMITMMMMMTKVMTARDHDDKCVLHTDAIQWNLNESYDLNRTDKTTQTN